MERVDENHSFNVNIATSLCHIPKAIILKELKRFCDYKIKHRQDVYFGYAWVYLSASSIELQYPYLKSKSVHRWLNEMEEEGLIASTKQLNRKKYDQTKWYCINNKAYADMAERLETNISQNEKWISQIRGMDFSKCELQFSKKEVLNSQNEKPIPPLSSSIPSSIERPPTEESQNANTEPHTPQWVTCQQHIIACLKGDYANLLRGSRERSKYAGRMTEIIGDYCRNISEGLIEGKGDFHLMPPAKEDEHWKWLGKMLAGIERYMKAAVRRQNNGYPNKNQVPLIYTPPPGARVAKQAPPDREQYDLSALEDYLSNFGASKATAR